MAGLVLAGVSRVYTGGVVAVKDLDLEIREQEFVVLVGPSGCGKTTTLRLISGLERVSAGTIRLGDRLVNDEAPRRRNVAMVFQGFALYPHLTVRGNLAFGLELRYGGRWIQRAWRRVFNRSATADVARRRSQIETRVAQAAATLGIEALLDRRPHELSGGERQRVALGRAIVHEPAVFLFDEPLSNLDAQLRAQMRRELKQLQGRLATTMVYVTHDQVEALSLADRVVVMEKGRVRQVGPPDEVYDRPADCFVAGFIGNPPMNLIEGEWLDHVGGARFAGKNWRLAIDERLSDGVQGVGGEGGRRGVTLGIRPQDVYLGAEKETEFWVAAGAAEVAAVEPMGDSTIIHVRPLGEANGSPGEAGRPPASGEWLRARMPPRDGRRPGDRVQVWFDVNKAHWFDAQTGLRLPNRRT